MGAGGLSSMPLIVAFFFQVARVRTNNEVKIGRARLQNYEKIAEVGVDFFRKMGIVFFLNH